MTKKRRITSIKKKTRTKHIDYWLLIAVIVAVLFGVLMVFDSSVIQAHRDFMDKFYFAKLQSLWVAIGIITMIFFSRIPYTAYRKLSASLLGISILLLFLVLIPPIGTKVLGAKRWIQVVGVTIQPAEFAKLSLILYLSTILEKKDKFAQIAIIVSVIIGLILLQPDLGTSIVVASIAFGIYFLSGASLFKLIPPALGGLIIGSFFILSSEYRRARVATFLDPMSDPLGASYHIRQILIALGSGGLFGVGVGKSRQKFEYIPAATTDSIFAIVAEEIGFVGSLVVILLLLFIMIKALMIAKHAPDKFSKLLAGGIAIWISSQTLLNLSTMVALVPLTGIPLPFISYGGSSIVSTLAAVGILLNISKHESSAK